MSSEKASMHNICANTVTEGEGFYIVYIHFPASLSVLMTHSDSEAVLVNAALHYKQAALGSGHITNLWLLLPPGCLLLWVFSSTEWLDQISLHHSFTTTEVQQT